METAEDETTLHVRSACRGDLQSVEWLVRRMTPLLLAQGRFHLSRLPASDHAAEDLVQEVWAVALLRLHGLTPQSGRMTPVLVAFLAKTLRNKALNWLRRQATATRRVQQPLDAATPSLAAATVDVLGDVINRERLGLLATALDSLEEADREILILRGLEGNSYDDLAAVLAVDEGALRMRYLRARQRLRERLPASVFEELGD